MRGCMVTKLMNLKNVCNHFCRYVAGTTEYDLEIVIVWQ